MCAPVQHGIAALQQELARLLCGGAAKESTAVVLRRPRPKVQQGPSASGRGEARALLENNINAVKILTRHQM